MHQKNVLIFRRSVGAAEKSPRVFSPLLAAVICAVTPSSPVAGYAASLSNGARPWNVAGEIGLAQFGGFSFTWSAPAITMSPNGQWISAFVERGDVKTSHVVGELRIYASSALRGFADEKSPTSPPRPEITVEVEGSASPIIDAPLWTRDSQYLAFIAPDRDDKRSLRLLDVSRDTIKVLSLPHQDVMTYDVVDSKRYVYTVRDPRVWIRPLDERKAVAFVATGQELPELMFPRDVFPADVAIDDRSIIWLSSSGTPHELRDHATLLPISIYSEWYNGVHLSPDGMNVVTELPARVVPKDWPKRFMLPRPNFMLPFQVGPQNTDAFEGFLVTGRYAIITKNGVIHYPIDAPSGNTSGWHTYAMPSWSGDSRFALLPSVYVPEVAAPQKPVRPCAAIFDVKSNTLQCLERLKDKYTAQGPELGFYRFYQVDFEPNALIASLYYETVDGIKGRRTYRFDGRKWQFAGGAKVSRDDERAVIVHQGLNEPPTLLSPIGPYGRRIVWDPNPQIGKMKTRDARIYKWRDSSGTERVGGLYLPNEYSPMRRYPLVIQAHGFFPNQYLPSGLYPTAFAARALAASGIAVLQVRDCNWTSDPKEVPCQLDAYASAVAQLERDGVIDKSKVGMVGFSRTVFYTLAALEQNSFHISAASITDGVDGGYFQAVTSVDEFNNRDIHELSGMLGGDLFAGDGARAWLKNSPLFHMDKVHTPLQVVALGIPDVTEMWEPYAALRYLHRPVDFIVINSAEHVLSNPGARLASQGGTVDWMRFWLQGYEDPAPEKAAQYRRWEKLCGLQIEENPGQPTWCVPRKVLRSPRSRH